MPVLPGNWAKCFFLESFLEAVSQQCVLLVSGNGLVCGSRLSLPMRGARAPGLCSPRVPLGGLLRGSGGHLGGPGKHPQPWWFRLRSLPPERSLTHPIPEAHRGLQKLDALGFFFSRLLIPIQEGASQLVVNTQTRFCVCALFQDF